MRSPSAAVVIVLLAPIALLAAACGGPSTPGVATASTTTPVSSSAGGSAQASGLLAYSSCMRLHGVPNFPDPTSSGGIPKQAVVSALRAVSTSIAEAASNDCEHLVPGGSLSGKASQPVTVHEQQYYLEAVACMRSHGITDFPDPTFSGGNVNVHIPSSIDTHSTQFIEADQTCRKLIPAGLPYSGSGG